MLQGTFINHVDMAGGRGVCQISISSASIRVSYLDNTVELLRKHKELIQVLMEETFLIVFYQKNISYQQKWAHG